MLTSMSKLIICKGLPASGKSTWARKEADKPLVRRVNRDDIRVELHGENKWTPARERETVARRNELIRVYLGSNCTVISDDTNLSPKVEAELRSIAAEFGATVEVQDFTSVHVDDCIKRDAQRKAMVGADVIRRMYNQYLRTAPEPQDPSLPRAILVDMDGTLALMGDRSPYEDQFADRDRLNQPVFDMVQAYSLATNAKLIIMSGRDEGRSRVVTTEWLENHNVPYDFIYMRAAGDERKDSIVKMELFDRYIKNRYCVDFVVDDRDQVVRMWRDDLGLTVFQVGWGNF